MPNTTLKILHLEDYDLDVELIRGLLKAEGLEAEIRWARNAAEFKEGLSQNWDVILSDYTIPGFNGMAALEVAKAKAPNCPFIFISGTIGEEAAIEALKHGATDYVLKDRPGRLGPAIKRALHEAKENADRVKAEEDLKTSREQLRALAARLQAAREEERIRISRELHDGLGEMLTGIDIGLTWLGQALTKSGQPVPEEVEKQIKNLNHLTSGTAQRVRKLCMELRPSVLDDLGLVPAIIWQAKEFEARSKIRCQTDQLEEFALPRDHATTLFRIFQEILTNAARHSHATTITVFLKKIGSEVQLQVVDNGRGISPQEIRGAKSFGLLGMRERAAILEGKVEISGKPGEGTIVTVTLPLPAEANV